MQVASIKYIQVFRKILLSSLRYCKTDAAVPYTACHKHANHLFSSLCLKNASYPRQNKTLPKPSSSFVIKSVIPLPLAFIGVVNVFN